MNIYAILFLCIYGIILLRGINRLGKGNEMMIMKRTTYGKAGAGDLIAVAIGVPWFLLSIGVL